MQFEPNRTEGKLFKAIIVKSGMLINKKDTIVTVSYYHEHHGNHMWKDVEKTFLVYYESDIKLLEEIESKVA